jgi:hypothetical protein
LLITLVALGCQNAANTNTANSAGNSNAANTNASAANTPAAASSPTSSSTEFSLATPTDAYKTAYAMREKKDVEGMKKVMSKDVLDFLTDIGKEDKKSADDMIKEMFDQPQAKTPESKDEKITGDTATLQYKDETGVWRTMDFIKDGSDWKLTIPKADKAGADGPATNSGKKK